MAIGLRQLIASFSAAECRMLTKYDESSRDEEKSKYRQHGTRSLVMRKSKVDVGGMHHGTAPPGRPVIRFRRRRRVLVNIDDLPLK